MNFWNPRPPVLPTDDRMSREKAQTYSADSVVHKPVRWTIATSADFFKDGLDAIKYDVPFGRTPLETAGSACSTGISCAMAKIDSNRPDAKANNLKILIFKHKYIRDCKNNTKISYFCIYVSFG